MHIKNERWVWILDNDRRNKHVGRALQKLIEKGEKVCIWDNTVPEHHDINDLILIGWSAQRIKETIDRCTCEGIEAHLKYEQWRKFENGFK